MKKRIIIAAGGTGGHLYPAMRLAGSLTDYDILFMGGGLDNSHYFDREVHSYKSIEAHPWKGFSINSLWNLTAGNLKGLLQARKALKNSDPVAIIGFGSFHTLPVMAAAKLCKIPLFQYEANSLPGKVVRLFSPYASMTAVQFPLAKDALKGTSLLISMTGKFSSIDKKHLKAEALEYFNLDPSLKTILIAGGSQGAEAINETVIKTFCSRPLEGWQVLHFTGKTKRLESYQNAYNEANIKACVKPFEHRMDLAWSMCDLFIGRSGAGTVAELLQTSTPSILIPYPHASENHQWHNANYIAKALGGGVILDQDHLRPDALYKAFLDSKILLESRKTSMENYSKSIKLPTLETAAKEFLQKLH